MTLPDIELEENTSDLLYLLFVDHPKQEGLTYYSHLGRAWSFSYMFFKSSILCFMHGLVPYFFDDCVKATAKELELTYISSSNKEKHGKSE